MPGRISRYASLPAPGPPELGAPQVEDEGRQALEELDDDVAGDRVAVTTTSARCVVRSLPSTLPTKRRSDASSSSVARWIRASPLPFSSPIESSATRGSATPSTRSAKIAPIRAYWARFSAVESGLAPMSSRTNGPASVIIWTASAGRSTPGRRPRRRTRGGHPGAGVAGGHDRVGLAAADEVRGDEDRRRPSSRAGPAPGARPCR